MARLNAKSIIVNVETISPGDMVWEPGHNKGMIGFVVSSRKNGSSIILDHHVIWTDGIIRSSSEMYLRRL